MSTCSEPIGEKLRVVIVDDYDLVREGLKLVINSQDDMETVGEARDGPEGIRLAEALRPNVVLVDVSMPSMSGVEVARVIGARCPGVKVIGVTRHREPGFVTGMLNAGAVGYVLKQSPSEEVIRAIRSAAAGGQYIDRALTPPPRSTATVVNRTASGQDNPLPVLDEVEERVLRLVAASQSTQEIARQLSMSTSDVGTVKNAAMQKAGLATRVQVVEYVRGRGLR